MNANANAQTRKHTNAVSTGDTRAEEKKRQLFNERKSKKRQQDDKARKEKREKKKIERKQNGELGALEEEGLGIVDVAAEDEALVGEDHGTQWEVGEEEEEEEEEQEDEADGGDDDEIGDDYVEDVEDAPPVGNLDAETISADDDFDF